MKKSCPNCHKKKFSYLDLLLSGLPFSSGTLHCKHCDIRLIIVEPHGMSVFNMIIVNPIIGVTLVFLSFISLLSLDSILTCIVILALSAFFKLLLFRSIKISEIT